MTRGEIIELGNHRVMCGDCTDINDVKELIQDKRVKLLFTSPPYADIRTYNGCNTDIKYIVKFIPVVKDYVDVMCVNLGIKKKNFEVVPYWNRYIEEARACGLKLLSWNVWNKTFAGSIYQQQAMFPIEHEFIFVFGEKSYELNRTVPKRENYWKDKREFTNRTQSDGTKKRTHIRFNHNTPYKKLGSVITVFSERGRIRSKHPAVMPVKLAIEYIKAMTNEGDYVLDCFAGSGTTLIACELTGRKCLSMEISHEYCDVIKERYENIGDRNYVFKFTESINASGKDGSTCSDSRNECCGEYGSGT